MLTPGDIEKLNEGFKVFDHDWRSYSQLLGEPYLVNGDTLVYFDGQAARIVAFRLGGVEWPYDSQEVSGLIASPSPEAELITISGNLSTDVASQRGVANLESIAGLPWRETFDSREHAAKSGLQSFANYTIDARSFDYAARRLVGPTGCTGCDLIDDVAHAMSRLRTDQESAVARISAIR